MSVTPFDHPLLSGLLGDTELAPQFSAEAELEEMVYFEKALAAAEAAEAIVPADSAAYIAERIGGFSADLEAIASATARDGVVVPEFIRQLREFIGAPHSQYIHFGTTSQDVIDTALVLRLRPVLTEFRVRLEGLATALGQLDRQYGEREVMGRTRMQDAVPIHVRDRIASWRGPLLRDLDRLEQLSPRLLVLQFGGAAGTLDQLGDKAQAVAARLAGMLDLGLPDRSWHNQRDNLVELAGWCSLVSGSLGKFGADIALMAQNSVGEVGLEGGGASSAMLHKSNPVAAETLVTLAQFNATLVGGMHRALVHEQERSGSAWALEWLVLPQMVVATAAGLRTALTLCGQLTRLGRA